MASETNLCKNHVEIFTQLEAFVVVAVLIHLIWLNYFPFKHSLWNFYVPSVFVWSIIVKFTCPFCFAETEAERLASSWGFYSGIVGTHYNGFLQNLWNQAYEVHFLDVMCEEDGMEDCNLG